MTGDLGCRIPLPVIGGSRSTVSLLVKREVAFLNGLALNSLWSLGVRTASDVLFLAASWCGGTAGLGLRVSSCVNR